jgi:Putative Flp pilus-assembly TadE/G-like
MFGKALRLRGFKRGQIAVAMLLVMVPLLGVIGLGTDLGLLFFHWGIVQKAVDAAVLAGAGYLPNHTGTAQTKATSYATQNGLKNSEIVSNTVAADNMSITMTTSRTVPYYFLQLVGVSSGTVKPMAKAGIHQDTEGARGLILSVCRVRPPVAITQQERSITWCKLARTETEGAGTSAPVTGDDSRSADQARRSF